MKHRVKIEVPLSGLNDSGEIQTDTFTIQPPCFYCQKPLASHGNGFFEIEEDYPIKFWGYVQDTHKPRLGNMIDRYGNVVRGKYIIRIPYCPDHIKPVRTFTVIDTLSILFGLGLGIALTALFGSELLHGTSLVLAFILVPLITAGLTFSIGAGIKSILPRVSPKLKDYASHKGHYGICSHGVRVRGGQEMTGPITYWLELAFCSPEGAERFLASNPSARVTQGERFLANSS